MDTYWQLNTHGKPLARLRDFVKAIWYQDQLESVLAPQYAMLPAVPGAHLLDDPEQLERFNPFKPLMNLNAAALLPDHLRKDDQAHLGALLRPCEMRALVEMTKHNGFRADRLLTFSFDCLGTYPLAEYAWRVERKGGDESLTQETLQFARQGGIAAYRFRAACQICDSPGASGADLNLHVLGLPVRTALLVSASEDTADRLNLACHTDGPAGQELVESHLRQVARLDARNQQVRHRLIQGLQEILPADVDSLVEQFESCGSCQACMNACPICQVDQPRPGEAGRYRRQDVMRWLVSCAGCGMCEQACPHDKPLSAIFSHIRDQLVRELDYHPGRSYRETLPIL